MFRFLCKVFKHNFKYSRRYYRCTRCGLRRCDLPRKELSISNAMNYARVDTSDSDFGRNIVEGKPDKDSNGQ